MRLDDEQTDCVPSLKYDHHKLPITIIKPARVASIPWSYVQPEATRQRSRIFQALHGGSECKVTFSTVYLTLCLVLLINSLPFLTNTDYVASCRAQELGV